MNNPSRAILGIVRLAAVMTVVVSDVRSIVFPDYSLVADKTFAVNLFYFFTGLGHEAFVVYLVLSGYLLGGGSYRRWHLDPSQTLADVRKRAIRFYALCVPAVLFGFSLDLIGVGLSLRGGMYPDVVHFVSTFDLKALAGNLLMLQRFLVPAIGTNAPLWLVAFECWAYLVFASMFVFGQGGRRRGLWWALLIMLIGSVLAPAFLGYLLVWMMGVFTSRAGGVVTVRISRSAAALSFLLMIVFSRSAGLFPHEFAHGAVVSMRLALDMTLGFALACLLVAIKPVSTCPWVRSFYWRLSRHVGDAGATLLVMHYPVALFACAMVQAVLRGPLNAQPGTGEQLVFVAVLALVWECARVLAKFGAILAYGFYPRQHLGR